jgi:outer membrane protein assembly factor BamB
MIMENPEAKETRPPLATPPEAVRPVRRPRLIVPRVDVHCPAGHALNIPAEYAVRRSVFCPQCRASFRADAQTMRAAAKKARVGMPGRLCLPLRLFGKRAPVPTPATAPANPAAVPAAVAAVAVPAVAAGRILSAAPLPVSPRTFARLTGVSTWTISGILHAALFALLVLPCYRLQAPREQPPLVLTYTNQPLCPLRDFESPTRRDIFRKAQDGGEPTPAPAPEETPPADGDSPLAAAGAEAESVREPAAPVRPRSEESMEDMSIPMTAAPMAPRLAPIGLDGLIGGIDGLQIRGPTAAEIGAGGLGFVYPLGIRPVDGGGKAPRALPSKWDAYINRQIQLPKPSGWHFHYPWFISAPAVADLTPSPGLEVVTGTEEGIYEYFPLGNGQGRYVCVSAAGANLWEYRTDNNAGRASPAIADVRGNGQPCVVGGSTSGWMVHCFDGANGKRLWRHEVDGAQANILAPPAVADFRKDLPGLEIIAVALNGRVVAVDAQGKRLWDDLPFGQVLWAPNSAAPVLEDIDGDGRIEVVTVLAGMVKNDVAVRVTVYDAAGGKKRWSRDFWPMPNNQAAQIASLPSLPSPVVVRPGLRAAARKGEAARGLIIAGFANTLVALDGVGEQCWRIDRRGVFSGAAVGDLDGGGSLRVVASAGRELVALELETGKERWCRELIEKEEDVPAAYRGVKPPSLLSSPALARRSLGGRGRIEWGMFGANPARTGCTEDPGAHDVYVAGCDGSVHTVSGRDGTILGKQKLSIPDLFISGQKAGALPYVSSPAVADIDSDGTLEILVNMVDCLRCLKDPGSSSPGMPAMPPERISQLAAFGAKPVVVILEAPADRPCLLDDEVVANAAIRAGVLLRRAWPPLAPAAERPAGAEQLEVWKRYDDAAARCRDTLKRWGVGGAPTLLCLAPGGRCVARIEGPNREQAVEMIRVAAAAVGAKPEAEQ